MYFVDRELIEAKLSFLDKQLTIFNKQSSWNNEIEKAALERICHLCIEAILDVGNAIIDGFIMRDPGSYDDIIDILLDETVINEKEAASLKKVISLRKVLVQEYLNVNIDELIAVYTEEETAVRSFPTKVRTYLINELGPVTAFKPLQP